MGDNFLDFINNEDKVSVVMFDHHQCDLCVKVRYFMKRVGDYVVGKYQ